MQYKGPCVDLEVNKIRGSARKIAVSEIMYLTKYKGPSVDRLKGY